MENQRAKLGWQPRWELTPLMVRQLKAIERTAGFLEAIRFEPGKLRALHARVQAQDALSSIQIEGGQLSLERAFELAGEHFEQGQAPGRLGRLSDSEREFLNYLRTFAQLDGLLGARDYRVSRSDVLNLHRSIVGGVRGGDRFAGSLRRESVAVGDLIHDAPLLAASEQGASHHNALASGEVVSIEPRAVVHHHPPPWSEVEGHLDDLLAWINASAVKPRRESIERVNPQAEPDPWVHPVMVAGVAQHRLVWIHPFVDGNGRTARMFTTLLLVYRGYDFKYLFDLSSYYNQDRDAYYSSLRHADKTGDYTGWLEYFLGGFAFQMFRAYDKAKTIASGFAEPAASRD